MRPGRFKYLRLSFAGFVAMIFLLPFLYLTLGAFAQTFSLTGTIRLSEWRFTVHNFMDLFSRAQLFRPLINSIVIAAIVTIGNLLCCTVCGYVLARRRFRGQAMLMASVTLVLMIPAHIVIIPLYLLTNWLGIFDTYLALTLPFLVNPLGIFLMRQYISSLPSEMEEAARLEGAGEWSVIRRVVMPMCKPALAVMAIQIFLVNWNSFLHPFILTSSDSMRTLPVALALLQGYQNIDVPQLFAAALLSAIPTIILFALNSKRITEGIIAGALKG